MSTTNRHSLRALSAVTLIALCVLCLQFLCGCAGTSGEEGAVEHAVKYANARTMLDMTPSCIVREMPDAKAEVVLVGLGETTGGTREIELESSVTSNTMASWSADEWAANRGDLFFNFAAHFSVICKQAQKYGGIPEDYEVTCPDYMVVYDSQKTKGFIVASTGVYEKTDDPENPVGEAVVIV